MNGKTRILTAHVPLGLADKNATAVGVDHSLDPVVKQGLAACIDQEERHQHTLAALADVDDGHIIDHQAILAWADSRGTDRLLPLSVE